MSDDFGLEFLNVVYRRKIVNRCCIQMTRTPHTTFLEDSWQCRCMSSGLQLLAEMDDSLSDSWKHSYVTAV